MPAAYQPKNGATAIGGLLLIECERAKKIESTQVPPLIEPGRQNAKDFMRLAVDANNAADNVVGSAEALLPAAVAKNNNVVVTGQLLTLQKIAAQVWADAKNGKEVRADPKGANDLRRLARLRQAGIAERVGADFAIGIHLASQVKVIGGRDTTLWILRSYAVEPLKLLALGVRQWFEENRIDDAEHGGVSADSETESDNGQQGKTGAAKERAKGKTKAGKHSRLKGDAGLRAI
jgi:hypothetical protein